jgi:hypothetical protein
MNIRELANIPKIVRTGAHSRRWPYPFPSPSPLRVPLAIGLRDETLAAYACRTSDKACPSADTIARDL